MTALLQVSGVTKAFGSYEVLRGLDLAVHDGELAAVLGPSGCGKSTLLRVVAGFERPDAGRVRLATRLLDGPGVHVPAERRGITVVPQDGALFPHLTVAQNAAFGLPRRAAGRARRVAEVLDLVGLSEFADRLPHQLSGGQQQRTAVARAMAPSPAVVLLDEPFSALDAGLRGQLRADLREAMRADRATAVLVTHDQDEALSVADHVAVMAEGVMTMAGTPQQVYLRPTSLAVARFVGELTELVGVARDGVVWTALGPLPLRPDQAGTTGPGRAVLRPEQVRIEAEGTGAIVRSTRYFGRDTEVTLEVRTDRALLLVRSRTRLPPGSPEVGIRVDGPVSFFADPLGVGADGGGPDGVLEVAAASPRRRGPLG
jgi:iron(III) transport system ATP-binding protein